MVDDPQLPYSRKAERAVLGSILINQDKLAPVLTIVGPDDFYLEQHRVILEAMQRADSPPDFLVVMEHLDRAGQREEAGGWAYVTELINATVSAYHAEHYAKMVAEHAVRRRLIEAGQRIVQHAYSQHDDDSLAFAHKALMDVGSGHQDGTVLASDAAASLYDQVEDWARNPLAFGQVRGLSTGIPSLDLLTMGLKAGDLVLLAARPSIGKSALAFEVARRIGLAGGRVCIFSLEMSTEKILARWASAMSQVPLKLIERGVAPEGYQGRGGWYASLEQLARFNKALAKLSEMPHMAINDLAGLNAQDIRAKTMATAQTFGGLDLGITDHSGLMAGESNGHENSAKTEGRKSQRMKELAKELDCPWILVQQLNRAVEMRSNKRPTLGDLRDSGEHEQNADIVLGLYRESYYNASVEEGGELDLTIEVHTLKHRDGPSGVHKKLRYERDISRFTEFVRGG